MRPVRSPSLLLNLAVFIGGVFGSHSAAAICSCQCMAGEARTLCSDASEAADAGDLCGVRPLRVACEPITEPLPSKSLPVPFDGVRDCRETRLWDPQTRTYSVPARVCATGNIEDSTPLP